MDEIENYSESIHEQSNEHAHHAAAEGKDKWVVWVALSTAIVAVLAAITGLLAGSHADDAMLAQMHSSDQWAFYQAKGIKADMLTSSNNLLIALGKAPDTAATSKAKRNKLEQADIMTKAKDFQKESDEHVARHEVLAKGVTLFQIAIAIGAISIITKRKSLWLISMGFMAFGIYFLLTGVI